MEILKSKKLFFSNPKHYELKKILPKNKHTTIKRILAKIYNDKNNYYAVFVKDKIYLIKLKQIYAQYFFNHEIVKEKHGKIYYYANFDLKPQFLKLQLQYKFIAETQQIPQIDLLIKEIEFTNGTYKIHYDYNSKEQHFNEKIKIINFTLNFCNRFEIDFTKNIISFVINYYHNFTFKLKPYQNHIEFFKELQKGNPLQFIELTTELLKADSLPLKKYEDEFFKIFLDLYEYENFKKI